VIGVDRVVKSMPIMGTIVTIEVLPATTGDVEPSGNAIDRAFEWFREVERVCNRFDPSSELRQIGARAGDKTPVGEILFGALEFALALAADTDGAFDPTIGARMESRGFQVDYRTGHTAPSGIADDATVSYRDVHLDRTARAVTVDRPLLLDLGAVAKGLAIDLAARELRPFRNFGIDAGGDVFVGGLNASREPWSVGVRHPLRDGELVDVVRVSNGAVCTSAGHERPAPAGEGHHILDGRDRAPSTAAASATVVAETAMVADAFATAAFVLGPADGVAFLARHEVSGVIYSAAMARCATPDFGSDHAAVFPDA